MRPKVLPITGASAQYAAVQPEGGVMLAAPSLSLRDALTTVGLSYEGAAVALGCSASRVQAKCDPKRIDAPVTWADAIRLARAGGKAREAARILYEELGSELESEHVVPASTMLAVLGMNFVSASMDVGTTVHAFVASPGEATRTVALRAIGSARRALMALQEGISKRS